MAGGTARPPRFRGTALGGGPGETLVQRLARRGLPILQRSIRYHRPRAPYCGVGQCTQCLVRVNGVPNVRGCVYVPSDGDRIVTENAWPSPSWDVLGILDSIFYRGLDTSHGFLRPSWAAPLYHRIVRRLAGFGRVPDPDARTPRAGDAPSPPLETDALVIGAGPSGRAAARRLADRGIATALVDRRDGPPIAHVTCLAKTSIVFLPPPAPGLPPGFSAVAVRPGAAARLVRARRVIVATGSYDGPLLFAGGDRPGVMTAEGALSVSLTPGSEPFQHAVVFGGGPRVAAVLERFGGLLEAIVAPGSVVPEVVERASALEVPIYPRTLLLAAEGRRRVRSLRLQTRGRGPTFSLDADAIILAHRRLPNSQLLYQAGARMAWHAAPGAYFPELHRSGTTTVPGLFAAGSVAEAVPLGTAESSGVSAADAALGTTNGVGPLPEGPNGFGELEGYYAELLRTPRARGKWVVCPCEDVLLSEIEQAVRDGYRGIEVIKRHTGVGTGLCQGRYCLPDALLLLAQLEGRSPSEVGYITQRPPVFPTGLDALAAMAGTGLEAEGGP